MLFRSVGNTATQKGIAWADFDRDGYQDLAISGSSVQTVIYKNVNGTLTGPVWTSNSVNTSSQELITGDVDRDGYPELAVVHFGGGRVEIFKNRDGVLDTEPSWLYIAGSSATSISFGDVNGDGALDLAVGTARSPVVVFLNQLTVPVELTSFTASISENEVQLIWTTATETNNEGFEIQRKKSVDRSQELEWEELAFVPGFGTTTEPNAYSFVDKDLPEGKYQYRLKQIDFDGTTSFSHIVEVEIISPVSFSLEQNFPNPFNPGTTIKFTVPVTLSPSINSGQASEGSLVTLKVYDVLENEVASLINEFKQAGSYEIEFNATGIPSGTYFYQLRTGKYFETKKMILMK